MGRCNPLGTPVTSLSTVPVQDYRRFWSTRWNYNWQGKVTLSKRSQKHNRLLKIAVKGPYLMAHLSYIHTYMLACPSGTLSYDLTWNRTWAARVGSRRLTNCLSYDRDMWLIVYHISYTCTYRLHLSWMGFSSPNNIHQPEERKTSQRRS
jgi:hypothetical protein